MAFRHAAPEPVLDEQDRRRFTVAEVRMVGHGDVSVVLRSTGLAQSPIQQSLLAIPTWKSMVLRGQPRFCFLRQEG